MPMRSRAGLALQAALALSCGAVLYLLVRSPALPISRWASAIGISSQVDAFRASLAPVSAALPMWIVYSLPSALWCYSLTLCITLVWRSTEHVERWIWLATPALIAAAIELGQHTSRLRGTADPIDLATSLAAWGLAISLTRPREVPTCHV